MNYPHGAQAVPHFIILPQPASLFFFQIRPVFFFVMPDASAFLLRQQVKYSTDHNN